MSEPLSIVETTGSERGVELNNRALPFKGVSFAGEQRSEKTNYPGNPVSTLQVLGPNELPTEMQGRWKDQFLYGMVTLTGWDAIVSDGEHPSAEQLVKIFHILRRSGNLLEVRWGPEIRRGILKRFDPIYDRVDAVRWNMTFEWTQFGTAQASQFTGVQPTESMSAELAATLAALNDLTSGMPQIMYPTFADDLLELQGLIMVAAIALMEANAEVQGTPEVTQDEFQGVASRAADVVASCEVMRQALDVPGTELVPTDDVSSVLAGSTWSKDTMKALVELAVAAVRTREMIRNRTVSEYLADIRLRESQTLRDVSREYYGAADDWTIIANANGLIGSIHDAGTRILVPRQSWSTS